MSKIFKYSFRIYSCYEMISRCSFQKRKKKEEEETERKKDLRQIKIKMEIISERSKNSLGTLVIIIKFEK